MKYHAVDLIFFLNLSFAQVPLYLIVYLINQIKIPIEYDQVNI